MILLKSDSVATHQHHQSASNGRNPGLAQTLLTDVQAFARQRFNKLFPFLRNVSHKVISIFHRETAHLVGGREPSRRKCYRHLMELTEAQDQARLIFENEQNRPTLNYRYISIEWLEELKYEPNASWGSAGAGTIALNRIRKRLPRKVYENPDHWQFESTNYTLIMAIYSQLSDTNRGLFLGGSLNVWTWKYIAPRMEAQHWFPSWAGHTSSPSVTGSTAVRRRSSASGPL